MTRRTPRPERWALFALAAALGACSRVELRPLARGVRGRNVAVYLTVRRPDGSPVIGLPTHRFNVTQDGRAVAEQPALRALLAAGRALDRRVALLVELPPAGAPPGEIAELLFAVQQFVSRVAPAQPITLWAFDGGDEPRALLPPAAAAASSGAALDALRDLRLREDAGALGPALARLRARLSRELAEATAPLRAGTLVVVARAGTLVAPEAGPRAAATPTAGQPPTREPSTREPPTGEPATREPSIDVVSIIAGPRLRPALEELAARLAHDAEGAYLLSLCLPPPAGPHTLGLGLFTEDWAAGEATLPIETAEAPSCDPADLPPLERLP